jgi:hypothetical protein
VYLLRVVLGQLPAIKPKAKIPLVLFPALERRKDAALAVATPVAVLVHDAYVYLFRTLLAPPEYPNAKIPLVLLPEAEPKPELPLEVATQDVVLEQVAYVYLLRIFVPRPQEAVAPNAKIPLVLLPAAAPLRDPILAAPTPQIVLVHDAYVYLLRLVVKSPNAKIPTVPSGPQPAADAPNPKPCAEKAPRVITAGIVSSLELSLRGKDRKGCASRFYDCVSVNINARRITR